MPLSPLKDIGANATLNEESKLAMDQLATPFADHKDRPRSSRQQQMRRGIGSNLQNEVLESLDVKKSQLAALEDTIDNLQVELQNRET